MITVIFALVGALAAATVTGWLLTRRSGLVRETQSSKASEASQAVQTAVADLGLSATGPTLVHFSAPWCGPCDRVRRVLDQVCAELSDSGYDIVHVEIDVEADPAATRRFSVLSLPTTLIFDIEGRQRYRSSGVPKSADLRSALDPLLA